jgi:hypothetical protein
MLPINFYAVLVAALANFFIGFMFHGPLFGKMWMRLANVTPTGDEKFSDMIPQMAWNLLANIVFAYVLATIYLSVVGALFKSPGLVTGLCVGFSIWLGFVVTSSSMEVIWMKRSVKLWLFELTASLVSILAMGAIIATWN